MKRIGATLGIILAVLALAYCFYQAREAHLPSSVTKGHKKAVLFCSLMSEKNRFLCFFGGGEGIRTLDFHVANVTLSH